MALYGRGLGLSTIEKIVAARHQLTSDAQSAQP
jgi:hypothetical protein